MYLQQTSEMTCSPPNYSSALSAAVSVFSAPGVKEAHIALGFLRQDILGERSIGPQYAEKRISQLAEGHPKRDEL